jgi:hypothetical protein
MNQGKPTVVKNPYAKTSNPYVKANNPYSKSSTSHATNKVPLSTASSLTTAVKKSDVPPPKAKEMPKPEVPKNPNAAKPTETRTFDKKNPPSLKMKLKKEIEDLKKHQQRQKERLEAERHRRKLEKQKRKQEAEQLKQLEERRKQEDEVKQHPTLPTPSSKKTANAHVTPSPHFEQSKESYVNSHPNKMCTQNPPETPFMNSKAASNSLENAQLDAIAKLENHGSSTHPFAKPSMHSHGTAPFVAPTAAPHPPTTALAAPPEIRSHHEHPLIANSMSHPLWIEPSSVSNTSYGNNPFAFASSNNLIPQIVQSNPFAHPMPDAAAMYSNPYAFSSGPWMPTWQQAVYQLQQQQLQHFYYGAPPTNILTAPMNPWTMTMVAASMGQGLPQAQSVRRTQKKKTPSQQQDWRLISTPCRSPSPFARTHEILPYSIVMVKHAQDHKGFGVTLKKVAECALVGFDEWPMHELVPSETTKGVKAEMTNTRVSASKENKVAVSDVNEIDNAENADPQGHQNGSVEMIDAANDSNEHPKDDRLAVLDTCLKVTQNDATMAASSSTAVSDSPNATVASSLIPDERDATDATPLAATSVLDTSQTVADNDTTMHETLFDPLEPMIIDSTTEASHPSQSSSSLVPTESVNGSSAISASIGNQLIADQGKMDEAPTQQSTLLGDKLIPDSSEPSPSLTKTELKDSSPINTSSLAEALQSSHDRQRKRRRLFFCAMEV